jgi:hypothetical protein
VLRDQHRERVLTVLEHQRPQGVLRRQ